MAERERAMLEAAGSVPAIRSTFRLRRCGSAAGCDMTAPPGRRVAAGRAKTDTPGKLIW